MEYKNEHVSLFCKIYSSRFQESHLKLNGKEMILWVAENCSKAVKSRMFIATDNKI